MSALVQAECAWCGREMTCSPAGGLAEAPVCSMYCARRHTTERALDEMYESIRAADAQLDPRRIKGVL